MGLGTLKITKFPIINRTAGLSIGTGGSVKGWAPLRGVFWFGIVVCVLYLTRTFLGQILPPAFISEVRLHYSPHM